MLSTLGAVRQAGFEAVIAAPGAGALAEAVAARGVEVAPLAWRDASGARLELSALRRELETLLRVRQPDLVDCNSLAMGRVAGPVMAALGMPSLAHLRDIVGLSRAAVLDLNCHRRLLAVSRVTRRFHVVAGLDPHKTVVLYNGVDLDAFRPRPPSGYLHRELNLPADAMLVGAICQISLRKGLDVLVPAAAQVAVPMPHVHFVHTGARLSDKPETVALEAALEQAATEGPLAGRLHRLGTRYDVERLLPELSLLVHPARQEPLGRVLLEAAASGVAIVATDVGGTREIFPLDGQAALLVPPGDPQALAAAMLALLDDPIKRRRLGAAARQRAEAAFDIRSAAAGLVEQYQNVLTG